MWPQLLAQWHEKGIEAYSQHFSIRAPGKAPVTYHFDTEKIASDDDSLQVNGTNVYAFVRAGRAQSTEAIVLCARADWHQRATAGLLQVCA